MFSSTSALTDRATEVARAEALGEWSDSFAVNSRRESALLVPGLLLVVICVVGGYFLLGTDAVPLAGRIVFALMGLAFFGIACAMAWAGLLYALSGRCLLHRFVRGFVLERTRGAVRAARYEAVAAQLFTYTEPGDSTGSPVDHVVLRLTFGDGTVAAMAEPHYGSAEALVELGERCGAGEPTTLSQLDARYMLQVESWQVRGRTD
ncbi:hypothetical protein [Streptomyces sp. NPDC005438]|uniref:hypothetical protein n=1 Tax=Streptomyces sp. NPDC005438 TaxID=3156880 RepID=UPI0033BF87A0